MWLQIKENNEIAYETTLHNNADGDEKNVIFGETISKKILTTDHFGFHRNFAQLSARLHGLPFVSFCLKSFVIRIFHTPTPHNIWLRSISRTVDISYLEHYLLLPP